MVVHISPRVQRRPTEDLMQQADRELSEFDGPKADDIWSPERLRVLRELVQIATPAEQQAVASELTRIERGAQR
ncbi:MAG TPA: hypothetical protein DDW52_26975 [Planctomycetaceae bacterium]|nr:hypothetical protein [Planctomycetaceae bacterium]